MQLLRSPLRMRDAALADMDVYVPFYVSQLTMPHMITDCNRVLSKEENAQLVQDFWGRLCRAAARARPQAGLSELQPGAQPAQRLRQQLGRSPHVPCTRRKPGHHRYRSALLQVLINYNFK